MAADGANGSTTRAKAVAGDAVSPQLEAFIQTWNACEGGAERSNCALFLIEFCDALGLPHPEGASARTAGNDYVFERAVRPHESEGRTAPKRIDLYKKGCFILEAKQSRRAIVETQDDLLPLEEPKAVRAGKARGLDVLMENARRQAEDYVSHLDADHPAPPFIIVCDVGRSFDLYADFSGSGRNYKFFPDRLSFRCTLDDLRDPDIRHRLKSVWLNPERLDPSKRAAKVTRRIAESLARISKSLRRRGCNPEHTGEFLMRCVFTMFAEDVGFLPPESFTRVLEKSIHDPSHFTLRIKELWAAMEAGGFSHTIDAAVRHFNGGVFKNTTAFELKRMEIEDMLRAAKADWRDVDPAIFGTLLEQVLDPTERRKLGAHYTPTAYVERLVAETVLAPLNRDWRKTVTAAEEAQDRGELAEAKRLLHEFHAYLCEVRVLDPACGTGNFLYVSLRLMKELEAEIVQRLSDLGEEQAPPQIPGGTVCPFQLLGLEVNPNFAAIAELVVWIGYLQWHVRTFEGDPVQPILRAFGKIERRDAVLEWDGGGPLFARKDGEVKEAYPNPRRPSWPDAEFIVGNPPFIGGKDLRNRLGDEYTEALWKAHTHMNESADFVMYWWDRAAEHLTRRGSPLRRFGLVTTNSIRGVFQRRVVERHLTADKPMSLVLAIPDHPWTKASRDTASVRISMTVGEAGEKLGALLELRREEMLDTDEPKLEFNRLEGKINSDLTIGADVTKTVPLRANEGICSPGVKLHGAGFIVTDTQAEALGFGDRTGLENYIRPYRHGRDLTARLRGVKVIDLYGLTSEQVRIRFPEVYQHLTSTVKAARQAQFTKSPTSDARSYLESWWLLGKPRTELRPALDGLQRYIVTVETAKHRVFQFLSSEITADNMLVAVASDDPAVLAILSSRYHTTWAPAAGGWLGYGNDPRYSKSRVFDPFPFPELGQALRRRLQAAGEDLDAHRAMVLAAHPNLTLTTLYNVLEKVRAEVRLSAKEEAMKRRGLVLILMELHDRIDALVAEAFGWPADLSDSEILTRLVALNAERAAEERRGVVRWLRAEYQVPRFARGPALDRGRLPAADIAPDQGILGIFPSAPAEQPFAVLEAISKEPLTPSGIVLRFEPVTRPTERRVRAILSTLKRYGHADEMIDGSYLARRAA